MLANAARPLSILHIAAPAPVGGLETVVQTLAVGHRRRGHDVHVMAVLGEGDEHHPFLAPLVEAEVNVIPLRLPSRAYLAERRQVRDVCARIRPDIVHTHGERPDVLDMGVAKRLGVPTVTTVHGSSKLGGITHVYEWLQLLTLRRFDAVVAVSRPLAKSLPRYGVRRERIHLVPNCWHGRLPEADRSAARRALGLPPTGFMVGWVGRLIHAKGGDVFLAALASLADVPLHVSVVGDGSEASRLRGMVRSLGLGERIVFHGQIDDAVNVFPAYDVFVLSSRTEGTPNVLFEAMAAEVPIVATHVGGVPDVISEADGLLVPPGDPAALAAAIRAVHDDTSAARTRAEAARRRLGTHFEVGTCLSGYEAVYRQVQRRGARDRAG